LKKNKKLLLIFISQNVILIYKSKRYSDCLFFCHLGLECLLKALIVKITNKPSPYAHDLERLAELAKLEIDAEVKKYLQTITKFNLESRYPEFKFRFYKSIDKKYCDKYFNITKKLILWLKKEINK